MNLLHISYINSFKEFAETAIEHSTYFKEIVHYSNSINDKAHEILSHAAEDPAVDVSKLQVEIFELGKEYVQKFASKHRIKKKIS